MPPASYQKEYDGDLFGKNDKKFALSGLMPEASKLLSTNRKEPTLPLDAGGIQAPKHGPNSMHHDPGGVELRLEEWRILAGSVPSHLLPLPELRDYTLLAGGEI
jgi:hypothetical protein